MQTKKLFIALLLGTATLTGCSSTIDPETGERKNALKGFNRKMGDFNYHVPDTYVLNPLLQGCKEYYISPI